MHLLDPNLAPYATFTQADDTLIISTRYGPRWSRLIGMIFLSLWVCLILLLLISAINSIAKDPFIIAHALLLLAIAGLVVWTWYRRLVAICNTITLTVTRDGIQRTEGPIAFGARNWAYPAQQIEGVYLKGIYYRVKKRERYRSEHLYLRLADGTDHVLFTDHFFDKPATAQQLELLIEDHLGISPKPLPEEYQAESVKRPRALKRAARDEDRYDPLKQGRRPGEKALKVLTPDLHLMARRDIIVIRGQGYQVRQAWQYSWENGQTDQWVQVDSIKDKTFGIFFTQEMGRYQPYYAELLSTRAMAADEDFPDEYNWKGESYRAQVYRTGQRHLRWQASGDWAEIRQCIYRSTEGKQLRLENICAANILNAYQDTPIHAEQIDDFLVWVA